MMRVSTVCLRFHIIIESAFPFRRAENSTGDWPRRPHVRPPRQRAARLTQMRGKVDCYTEREPRSRTSTIPLPTTPCAQPKLSIDVVLRTFVR